MHLGHDARPRRGSRLRAGWQGGEWSMPCSQRVERMTSIRAPKGVVLAPDEGVHIAEVLMYSTVAFYLHTELALTNRRFIATRPNTVLGLIPVGTNGASYPIENIAGVSAGTRFDILGVLFGGVALLFGVGTFGIDTARVLSVALILLGASSVINAPKQWVEVLNSGGGAIRFPVSVFERSRTLEFAGRVSETIAGTPRGQMSTVGAVATSAPRPRTEPADPAAALRQLDQLRSQGLITDDEFTAKRQAIIDRL